MPVACMQPPKAFIARCDDEPGYRANMIDMTTPPITNELDSLQSLVPLADARRVEAGCGAAHLGRELVSCHPTAEVVGIEVDERQLVKSLLTAEGFLFAKAGAQHLRFADVSLDGALMQKSLHQAPMPLMAQALAELAHALRPGGWQSKAEPVFAGEQDDLSACSTTKVKCVPPPRQR